MEKRGRGRPPLPRDEYGNVIRKARPEGAPRLGRPPKAAQAPEIRAPEPIPAPAPVPVPAPAKARRLEGVKKIEAAPQKRNMVYDSIADFIAAARLEPVIVPAHIQQHNYWRNQCYGNWYGPGIPDDANFEKIVEIVQNGWPMGISIVERARNRLEIPVAKSRRRRSIYTKQGGQFIQERVWNGDLDRAWRTTHREFSSGPSNVRITVDSIANGGMDSSTMAWRGAAAVALCEALTEAGYTVEMVSRFTSTSGGGIDCSVVTKAGTDTINIAALAASTVLPAFFRCIGHRWLFSEHGMRRYNPGSAVQVGSLSTRDVQSGDDNWIDLLAGQSIESAYGAQIWIKYALEKIQGGENPDN